MFCQKCGTENKDGSNFCVNCGQSLNAAAAQPQQVRPNYIASSSPERKGRFLKVVLYSIGGLFAFFIGLGVLGVMINSNMACDDEVVVDLLISAIDQSQFARLAELSAINISNVQDIGSYENDLYCSANVTFNNLQEARVEYTATPTDEYGEYWLEFEVVENY